MCLPIDGHLSGDSDVYARELEGGSVATTLHRGPYEQIGPVYLGLQEWISEHGHVVAGPPHEIYLNDPQAVAPEELLTRIEYPIHSKAD
jgi:effector-binding domain-containing protein